MGLWTCIFSTDAHIKNIERHSIKYVSIIDILLNFFQFTYDTDPIWFTVQHACIDANIGLKVDTHVRQLENSWFHWGCL